MVALLHAMNREQLTALGVAFGVAVLLLIGLTGGEEASGFEAGDVGDRPYHPPVYRPAELPRGSFDVYWQGRAIFGGEITSLMPLPAISAPKPRIGRIATPLLDPAPRGAAAYFVTGALSVHPNDLPEASGLLAIQEPSFPEPEDHRGKREWDMDVLYRVEGKPLQGLLFREDDEAYGVWREVIGLPEHKVMRLDEAENFWAMGDTGPCGPCAEIHIDFGENPRCTSEVCDPSCDCGRWLEIWNLVFMQFERDAAGNQTPLPKASVDTGAGLERLTAIIQGVPSVYETDLFAPIFERATELAGVARGHRASRGEGVAPRRGRELLVHGSHRALRPLLGDPHGPRGEPRVRRSRLRSLL